MTTAPSTAGFSGADEPLATELSSRLFFHRQPQVGENVVGELLGSLQQQPRSIAPKFFYDSTGARLFDHITRLPEYYPTRLEQEIFIKYRAAMADEIGTGRVLIEPGSGSSEKVALLLDALRPSAYVPVEITESHLLAASRKLVERNSWLTVHALCADYSHGIPLPADIPSGPRLVFFPGSTIGNFEPAAARSFLRHLHSACSVGGLLLIGVDLRKDPAVLNAAYNDSAGITARFNLNILDHVNRLTGGNFSTAKFRHLAFFNERQSRIEMHLESRCKQRVSVARTGLPLAVGERIHTENSYKYTLAGFRTLAAQAGFSARRVWLDRNGWMSVHLFDAI
ncbi:MAG: L-histidine N(alpha)-methyltransferase [Porticoccaceae bacterium]